MSEQRNIHILGKALHYRTDYTDIGKLKFLPDNPRVYAVTHGKREFGGLLEPEQQERIYSALQAQPGFGNLRKDIKRHGGLMEPILVRHDTREVIEGNTRLAVFRALHEEAAAGEWDLIPCNIVDRLSDEEQAAFLNQIHVTGKTQWSAYEKANFAYVRVQAGIEVGTLARLFNESAVMIRHRVNAVALMAENNDVELTHYSHYEVVLRRRVIANEMDSNPDFRSLLLRRIVEVDTRSKEEQLTAQELRDKLPVVIKKKRIFRRFLEESIELDEAYQLAKISRVEENVRRARELLSGVERRDIARVDANRLGSLALDMRRLRGEMTRLEQIMEDRRAQ